jgi:DNA mismatch repair ATPase MutS
MREEYTARLKRHQSGFAYRTKMVRITFFAIPVFTGLFGVCLYGAIVLHWFTPAYVVAAAGLLVGAIYLDNDVSRKQRRSQHLVRFYQRAVDRLDGQWIGKGNSGTAFLDANHAYARDLDIFGEGSLFEMLHTIGQTGQDTLARWLCEAASAEEIRNRQEAVRELRNDLDLHERIAQYGLPDSESQLAQAVQDWIEPPAPPISSWARGAAPFLVLCMVATAGLWWRQGIVFPAVVAGAAELSFAWFYRERVRDSAAKTRHLAFRLESAYGVLRVLENSVFQSIRLRGLQQELRSGRALPSSTLRRLIGFATLLRQTETEPVGPFLHLVLWSTQCVFAIDAWRSRFGDALQASLRVVGEFEALCCLAVYSREHPENVFPEILDRSRPAFEGENLRHPLIRDCVPNSIQLGEAPQLTVISGSNMSGKSTLLRTIGTNLVLAQAGAPVCATSLRSSSLAIGASLQIADSLRSGISRFYAEVRKLNQIMQLAEERPTIFLCDEVLSGTNSYDRAIGTKAVLQGFLAAGALGLVTTHDLTLTRIAEDLAPQAANAHFQDQIENGQMTFDYRLHRGVVRKSNALELMRAVGLKV